MAQNVSFCGITLQPVTPDEYAFMGPDPDALREYYSDRGAYNYTHFDAPVVKYILPEQIGGIQLAAHDIEHPEDFWSMHCNNGTMDTFQAIAGKIPEIRERLGQGLPMQEICQDPALRKCAEIYFMRPKDIPVVTLGKLFLFQSNGRHRVLAAMGLGHEIPVSVVGGLQREEP